MRKQLEQCAGEGLWHDVSGLDPVQTADFLCKHEPNIIVDLNGYGPLSVYLPTPPPISESIVHIFSCLIALWYCEWGHKFVKHLYPGGALHTDVGYRE